MIKTEETKNEKEIGIEIEGEWREISGIKSKELYNILLTIRAKRKKEEEKPSFKRLHAIKRRLTPKERDYWWRLNHGLISIKKNEHKWRKNEDGSQMSDKCPVCKEEIEDRQHYDYDCKQTQRFIDRITETFDEMKEKKKQQKRKKREYKSRPTPRVSAAVAEADKSGHYYYRDTYQGDYWKIANSPETIEREEKEEEEREKEWERKEVDRQKAEEEIEANAPPTNGIRPCRVEWNLEAKTMDEDRATLIAKARWIYHKERCRIDNKKVRTMNIDIITNRLKRQMNIGREQIHEE